MDVLTSDWLIINLSVPQHMISNGDGPKFPGDIGGGDRMPIIISTVATGIVCTVLSPENTTSFTAPNEYRF